MTTDKELLELAARAAGIDVGPEEDPIGRKFSDALGLWIRPGRWWNPIADGGAALHLAVALDIEIKQFRGECIVKWGTAGMPYKWCSEPLKPDADAATRRAIVRAAASIGQAQGDAHG